MAPYLAWTRGSTRERLRGSRRIPRYENAAPGGSEIKKVAFITDIHLDEALPSQLEVDSRANWKRMIEDVASRGIETVVFGGDIGTPEAHEWFFDSLREFELHMVLGNHDTCQEVVKHYNNDRQQSLDEMYYSFEDGGYKFVFMDSSSGEISKAQFDWFRRRLKSAARTVLFIHHPILAVESIADQRFALRGRSRVVSELQKLKQRVTVFCGHYHTNDERTDGRVEQLVTPAGSFQLVKDSDTLEFHTQSFGYRVISFETSGITTELVSFE